MLGPETSKLPQGGLLFIWESRLARLFMAFFEHAAAAWRCLLFRGERTCSQYRATSAFDRQRKSGTFSVFTPTHSHSILENPLQKNTSHSLPEPLGS
jgi:hypothetical protein